MKAFSISLSEHIHSTVYRDSNLSDRRLYQYNEDDFFINNALIPNKQLSNHKVTRKQREAVFSLFPCFCVSAVKRLVEIETNIESRLNCMDIYDNDV